MSGTIHRGGRKVDTAKSNDAHSRSPSSSVHQKRNGVSHPTRLTSRSADQQSGGRRDPPGDHHMCRLAAGECANARSLLSASSICLPSRAHVHTAAMRTACGLCGAHDADPQ